MDMSDVELVNIELGKVEAELAAVQHEAFRLRDQEQALENRVFELRAQLVKMLGDLRHPMSVSA